MHLLLSKIAGMEPGRKVLSPHIPFLYQDNNFFLKYSYVYKFEPKTKGFLIKSLKNTRKEGCFHNDKTL